MKFHARWWKDIETQYLPHGSLRSRVAKGSAWSMFGTIALQLSAMATAIITARLLGKSGFGELGVVRSTVMTFGVLAGTGLGLATTRLVAEFRTTDPPRAGRLIGLLLNTALGLSAVATIACALMSFPIAAHIMKAPWLSGALRIGALLLFLNTISGVQIGVLSGLEDFRSAAMLALGESILTGISAIAGAFYFGLAGAVAGSVIGASVAFPFKQRIVLHGCRDAGITISYRGVSPEFPAIWHYMVPAILLGISSQPFEWFARVHLARQLNGFGELGMFTAAYAWGQVVQLLPGQVMAPSMPILATLYAKGDRAGFVRMTRTVGLFTLACSLGVALPLIVSSKWIMRAYGSTFTNGWRVLALVALAAAVAGLSATFRAVLIATGRVWSQNLQVLIWSSSLLAAFLLLSPWGALGLACSYLAAFSIVVVTQGYAVWKAVAQINRPGPVVIP